MLRSGTTPRGIEQDISQKSMAALVVGVCVGGSRREEICDLLLIVADGLLLLD
jgi:hypothetical protein